MNFLQKRQRLSRKNWRTILVASICALVIIGCGSNSSEESEIVTDNGETNTANNDTTTTESISIDAIQYDAQSGTELENDAVGYFDQGDWIQYDNVDFLEGQFNLISLTIAAADSNEGGEVNVRIDSLDGEIVASFYIMGTGGWQTFEQQTANLASVTGTRSLFIEGVSGQGIGNIKSIELHSGDAIPEATLSTLTIYPTNPVLLPGDNIEFSVKAFDSNGQEVDSSNAQISFEASSGSINEEGLYSCDCDAATDTVTATLIIDEVSLTTDVEVVIHDGKQTLNDVVWAENAGGNSYLATDDVLYNPSTHFSNADVINANQAIFGTPDSTIYETGLSANDVTFDYQITNGTYNIHLKMAAISQIDSEFSIYAEGTLLKSNVNIVAARDGNANANYDLTFDNVNVTDGELNLLLSGDNALINALVITTPHQVTNAQLVWSDEFDSEEIDQTKWSFEDWAPGHVNNELQRYTDRTENARIEDGHLIIEARRDFYLNDEYSSARLHTAGKGDLLYGRIEVRAKLPDGRGTWPAIWMMPTHFFEYATTCSESTGWTANCDAWPNSGEIDIMEHVGYDSGQTWATVHNKAYYWVNGQQRKGGLWDETLTNDFHVYSIEWREDRIDIYKDDARYFTYMNEGTGWEAWPYDHSFHLILNLAVGGNWGAVQGVDTEIWPKQMMVDYVRMYKFDE